MAFASSRFARVGAAIVLSLGMTAGLASTVLAVVGTEAANSTVVPSPATVVADGTTTSTITVTLLSSTNVALVGNTVTLTQTSGPGTATISAASGLSTSSGVVTFTVRSTTAGADVFRATDTTDTVVITQTATVTFTPGSAIAAMSTLTPTSASIVANGTSTQVLTVTAKDAYGNTLTSGGATVTITKYSGTGTIIPTPTPTDNGDGTYTATVIAPTIAGSGDFVATLGGSVVQSGTANQTQAVITYTGGTASALSTVSASPTSVPADGATTSTITVTLKDSGGNPVPVKTVTLTQTSGPGTATISAASGLSTSSGVVTFTVKSSTAGADVFQARDTTDSFTVTQTATVTFTAAKIVVSAPSNAAIGTPFNVTVTAEDQYGNAAAGYTGTVHFTSSDGLAALPANYLFTAADAGSHVFSVTLNSAGTWYVTATDTVTPAVTGTSGAIIVAAAGTYHNVTPARLLDTRINLGITGPLHANSPASFLVWGRGSVPSNAAAVTGNLTVADSTSGWAVFLGPNSTSSPGSSTINFTAGQIVANGVTVALSPTGYLWATYISTSGQTTDLVFDVTGYFTPDTSGAYYHAITPVRVLDTRSGTGLSGKFSANTPRSFQVAGLYGVPSSAMAVTGNLTVTDATSGWAVFLGPNSTSSPGSSTINFKAGQTVANGVTVGLSTTGTLSATYMSTTGQTIDLVFDVTGYFVQGDTSGARYVPITPARILDTRVGNGLYGAQAANTPATFAVWGYGGVPSNALGVTGNLTVTDSTSGWAVFLGPNPNYAPSTSTVNFLAGQVVANGVTVGLSSTGTLSATYLSTTGQTTDLVFDVTGYFVH
jgi:hypothetical protein